MGSVHLTQLGVQTPFAQLTLPLREEHYRFWSRTVSRTVRSIDVYAESGPTTAASVAMVNASGAAPALSSGPADNSVGTLLAGVLGTTPPARPSAVDPLTIGMDSNHQQTGPARGGGERMIRSLTDVWIAIRWESPPAVTRTSKIRCWLASTGRPACSQDWLDDTRTRQSWGHSRDSDMWVLPVEYVRSAAIARRYRSHPSEVVSSRTPSARVARSSSCRARRCSADCPAVRRVVRGGAAAVVIG